MKFLKLVKSSFSIPIFTWEYVLATFIISISVSRLFAYFYSLVIPQKYSQFTVGAIAWTAGSKNFDYLILFGFLACFFLLFSALRMLAAFMREADQKNIETQFRQLIIYCSIPVGIWAGTIFRTDELNFEPINISSILMLLSIALTVILIGQKDKLFTSKEYSEIISSGLLAILLSPVNVSAILIAYNRISIAPDFTSILLKRVLMAMSWVMVFHLIFVLFTAIALFLIVTQKRGDVLQFKKSLRILLCSSQIALPLTFLILIPNPWINEDQKFYGYDISISLWLFSIVLILVGLVDLGIRFWQAIQVNNQNSILSAISPLSIIAVLLLLKSPVVGVSFIPSDDYHWGEHLLGYWLWKDHGYIPYQDYDPARGLVNYLPGFLADLFLNENASSYTAIIGGPILILPFIAVAYFVVAQTIGSLPAFLGLLFMPNPGGLFEIDIVVTVALCICVKLLLNQRWIAFLMTWLSACALLIMFGPGQGGLFLIATLPLAGFAFYKAMCGNRRNLLYSLGIFALCAIAISLLTPLDNILIGAFRYGIEQSSLNTTAYGIEWDKSRLNPARENYPPLTYPLFELIRTSWIVVSVFIGLLIYRTLIRGRVNQNKSFLFFAIPIFILTVLLIPRSAGRIDGGIMSRLGFTSIWVGCLLLPLGLLQKGKNGQKAMLIFLLAILGGILSAPLNLSTNLLSNSIAAVNVTKISILDSKVTGLPRLGSGVVEPAHLHRLQKISTILKSLLETNETYLDLTNFNAHYFYFDYPPPIQSGAPYNLVHLNQQVRALEALKKNPPPLILVKADSNNHDAASLALRPHLLYRYIIAEGYTPFSVDNFIFFIRPNLVERLNRIDISQISEEFPSNLFIGETLSKKLRLLDEAFLIHGYGMIPTAWGKSIDSLRGHMRQVADISSQIEPTLKSFVRRGDRYRISGTNPTLSYDISSLNLSGRDAGLLVFKYESCQQEPKTVLNIRWEDSQISQDGVPMFVSTTISNSWQIVPLDASPRWLLTEGLKRIQFEVASTACARFAISDVKLFQRAEVDQLRLLSGS